jgi:hypothetical protein
MTIVTLCYPFGEKKTNLIVNIKSQVCLELSLLVVALESECTRENCPEMKADGWLYLCAAHPSTQSVSISLVMSKHA